MLLSLSAPSFQAEGPAEVDLYVPYGSADAACSGRRRGSVAEAGGGTARHTRAWSVGAPTVVADFRRLRFRRAQNSLQ